MARIITFGALVASILVVAAFIGAFILMVAHFVQSWTSVMLTITAGLISISIYVTVGLSNVQACQRGLVLTRWETGATYSVNAE